MRALVLFVLILKIPSLSFIQTTELEDSAWDTAKLKKVAELLHKMYGQKQFNGTVLLAQDAKVIFETSLGYSHIKEAKKLQPNSSFLLASVSKQFTAMGIMMLKEQGKLDYDDDIRMHLPELPYEGVTIRHLLNHTSGLPNYVTLFDKIWDTGKPPHQRQIAFNQDLVEQFANHEPPIDFKPGEKYVYCNTGYVLLGQIIKRASSQRVRSFFQTRIFGPLGMEDSQAFSPFDDFDLDHRVYGFAYKADEGHRQNDFHYLNGMIGDGGIYASARDLLKWDQALYTEELVKQSTLKEAFTSGKLNDGSETGYGFGWEIGKTDKGALQVSHSGGWLGFKTRIEREIHGKHTLIVLTNHSSSYLQSVLENVKKIRDGKDYEIPKPSIAYIVAATIKEQGIEAAVAEYKSLKQNNSNDYDFSESQLNGLGYQYLEAPDYQPAIAIFRLNVQSYPDSANAHDSLGEALIAAGKQSFHQALKLNPGNQAARKVLESLGEDLPDPESD